MVERRIELDRRYHRKKKMGKLKEKLQRAKSTSERDAIVAKIMKISPWWNEAVAMAGKRGRQAAGAPKAKGPARASSSGSSRRK